jgi:hypothetical protein
MKGKNMANISDKLSKVNDSFTVYMYDNGYMVEVGGRNAEDDWSNTKIICNTLEEVVTLITEISQMPRD